MYRLASLRYLSCHQRCLKQARPSSLRGPVRAQAAQCQYRHASVVSTRPQSTSQLADEKIEEITELYATAKDEFEIAYEETEKMTVYAEDDRVAARTELAKVQKAYRSIIEGQDRDLAEEVTRRIGQRIRELEQGVAAMEEMALHQD